MYLKYFLESGIFAQDSKDSESRTLFYFVTDPSALSHIACEKLSREYLVHMMARSIVL